MTLVLFARVAAAAAMGLAAPALAAPDDLLLVAKTRAGPCTMTVEGGPSNFLITVTGLEPDETLALTSNSEGEVMKFEGKAQADGRYATIAVPLVEGKSFGQDTFEVVGRRCRISATFPWKE